ncbi:hypothetical protein AAHB63_15070 [Bacillus thuringiensis]
MGYDEKNEWFIVRNSWGKNLAIMDMRICIIKLY